MRTTFTAWECFIRFTGPIACSKSAAFPLMFYPIPEGYDFPNKEKKDIPDEWFLPCTVQGLPPRGKQIISGYIFSEAGWEANRMEIREHWANRNKYINQTFVEYEEIVVKKLHHYRKTQARFLNEARAEVARLESELEGKL